MNGASVMTSCPALNHLLRSGHTRVTTPPALPRPPGVPAAARHHRGTIYRTRLTYAQHPARHRLRDAVPLPLGHDPGRQAHRPIAPAPRGRPSV
jgi:hypothetical protein